MKTNARKEKRDHAANDIAKELRYQFANNCHDQHRLYKLMIIWMELTGKDKYSRPIIKGDPFPF